MFNKVGDRQLYKNLTPESIREEVDASLQRLGIDSIDIYMTHWQSVEPCFTPIAETVDTLNALEKRGENPFDWCGERRCRAYQRVSQTR